MCRVWIHSRGEWTAVRWKGTLYCCDSSHLFMFSSYNYFLEKFVRHTYGSVCILLVSLGETLAKSRIPSTAFYSLGSPLISIQVYSVAEFWKLEPGNITDCSVKMSKFD